MAQRKSTQRKSTQHNSVPPLSAISTSDTETPQDMEAFRWRLIQRINNKLQNWRACPRPPCRRARACKITGQACRGEPPLPPVSHADTARMMANLYRVLRQRVAEHEAAAAALPSPPAGEGGSHER